MKTWTIGTEENQEKYNKSTKRFFALNCDCIALNLKEYETN